MMTLAIIQLALKALRDTDIADKISKEMGWKRDDPFVKIIMEDVSTKLTSDKNDDKKIIKKVCKYHKKKFSSNKERIKK